MQPRVASPFAGGDVVGSAAAACAYGAGAASGLCDSDGRELWPFFSSLCSRGEYRKKYNCSDPLVFKTLNLDPYYSGKAELSSSFLALLSGRRHASSEMQLPYPGSVSAKLQVCDGGLVSGASSGVPVTCIPPSSEYHGHDAMRNGEFAPFAVSRPLSVSTCTNDPLHNNFRSAASSCHSPGFGNLVSHQAAQANCGGIDISPRTLGWLSSSNSVNASQWQILNQTTQKMPSEARPSVPSNSSATFTGRRRVLCMNKVGELFVSDMGFFGIICFCHELPMSVAKFCEHSGSHSANPGEAIHLENGMSIAQWRKLFFGVVFFAERDIYPGEEITYDYHLSHEDEDEKIPCFCNLKNIGVISISEN